MKFKIVILTLVLVFFASSQAQAHRMNVFAWLENNQIIVECNFGKDKPAKDATVDILDEITHKILLSGKTDATGHYVFQVPSVVRQGHGLVIDVNAGQGHHNEWTMDASELYAAASLTAGFDASALEQQAIDASRGKPLQTRPVTPNVDLSTPASSAVPGMTQDHVRAIVSEEVEKSVAPIRRHMAEKSMEGPTLVEIVGGLGWIIGIIGIVLYFKSRRKNA